MGPPSGRARRVVLGGIVVVSAGFGIWHWQDDGGALPVSEAEARAYFGRIVAAALANDLEALCALDGAEFNCRQQLGIAGEGTRPAEPPTIVGSRYHEKQFSDGTPGRILVVEGTDGRGNPYRTEVLVFREGDHLEATNAVYWGDFEIYDRDRTDQRIRDRDPESIPDPAG